jgi:hypothetical protein
MTIMRPDIDLSRITEANMLILAVVLCAGLAFLAYLIFVAPEMDAD